MVASAAFLSFQEYDLDRAEADVGRGRSTTYLDMVERTLPTRSDSTASCSAT